VPAGSVVVCVGLGSISDEFATELLVRILRDQNIDARHMSIEDMAAVPPREAVEAVSIVYIVSAFPSEERTHGEEVTQQMRRRFPHACIVGVYLRGMLLEAESDQALKGADQSAESLGHALQICRDMQPGPPTV
jgi:hypothetical protein